MPKRILEGNVVSNKMDKTVTVLVERRFLHPVYKKYVKHSSRFAAHDEGNLCDAEERVQIQECVPLSRRKTWQVITGKAGEANKAFFENRARGEAANEKGASAPKPEAKKPAAKKTASKGTKSSEKSTTSKAKPKASKTKASKSASAKKPAAKKSTAKKSNKDSK